MGTILGQRCTVYLDENSVQKFKIESSIDAVEPGDLPIFGSAPYTSNVFVHKIINALEPKQDTFLRVANVADLTTLPQGRETAIATNKTVYLSTAFTVVYDDIATATQAKPLIQQRVDNLIADWRNYNANFLAPVSIPPNYSQIPMPLTLSEQTARINAYTAAHATYLGAKVDNATATATYTAAVTAASAANETSAKAIADSQQCSTLLGQFNGAQTAVDAYRASMTDLTTQSQTYAVASSTFKTASDTFDAAAATYAGYGTTPTAPQLAVFNAAKTVWETAKNTWDSARTLWEGYVTAAAAAVQAEATAGGPVLDATHTSMSAACTTKIADVTIAATKKSDADKAQAKALTAKAEADATLAAAELADTQAFLSVKELCPTYQRITP